MRSRGDPHGKPHDGLVWFGNLTKTLTTRTSTSPSFYAAIKIIQSMTFWANNVILKIDIVTYYFLLNFSECGRKIDNPVICSIVARKGMKYSEHVIDESTKTYRPY